jgi:hypothetical protein
MRWRGIPTNRKAATACAFVITVPLAADAVGTVDQGGATVRLPFFATVAAMTAATIITTTVNARRIMPRMVAHHPRAHVPLRVSLRTLAQYSGLPPRRAVTGYSSPSK